MALLDAELVAHLVERSQVSLLVHHRRRFVSPARSSLRAGGLPAARGQRLTPWPLFRWRMGTWGFQNLHSHIPGKLLQLLPDFCAHHFGDVKDQLFPLDGLKAVRLMRDVQSDLYFFDRMQVLFIGVFKFKDEVAQSSVRQRFVHQIWSSAHAQRAVPAIAVNPKHHVMKIVPWEVGFKADGESLHGGLPVRQVSGVRRVKAPTGLRSEHTQLQLGETPSSGNCRDPRLLVSTDLYSLRPRNNWYCPKPVVALGE